MAGIFIKGKKNPMTVKGTKWNSFRKCNYELHHLLFEVFSLKKICHYKLLQDLKKQLHILELV